MFKTLRVHNILINTHEISTIRSAIANSASGYDELPASMLKQCSETYIEPLTY